MVFFTDRETLSCTKSEESPCVLYVSRFHNSKKQPLWSPNTVGSMTRSPGRCVVLIFMNTALACRYNSFLIRSEEHTSELQSRPHLVCRLLLEKKKNTQTRRVWPP